VADSDSDDVAGGPVGFTIDDTAVTTTPVDANGVATAAVSLDPASTPASFDMKVVGRDHAGNPCTSEHTYQVIYDGCDIQITSPTTVTRDADPGAGGSQADVGLQVATQDAGRSVTA